MDAYKETKETWHKIAAIYEEKFMDLRIYDETYLNFCMALKSHSPHVLEIGCGPGNVSAYLLNYLPTLQLIGIDNAPDMVKRAKINNPNATFLEMDGRQIDQLNMQFDGIIAGFCLPYLSIEDVKKLIKDAAKLLKEGGALYLSYVNGSASDSGYITGSTGDRMYFYYHSTEELTLILESCGFESPKLFEIPYQKSNGTHEVHQVLISNL